MPKAGHKLPGLIEAMDKRRITTLKLAQKTGYSESTISKLRQQRTGAGDDVLLAISEALNAPPSSLIWPQYEREPRKPVVVSKIIPLPQQIAQAVVEGDEERLGRLVRLSKDQGGAIPPNDHEAAYERWKERQRQKQELVRT